MSQAVAIDEAFNLLADDLEESVVVGENPYLGISLRDFFFDVFIKSFPEKDFHTWHIDLLLEDIQRAFDQGINFCGVLPRYHLKSTVGGYAVSIWRMVSLRNATVLYLSYKDGMARYHLGEIKRIIRDNPILSRTMRDLTSRSLATCRYEVTGAGVARILSGGVLSFKRGLHLDGCVVVDDCLRDPQNPLNISQLLVVERHIRGEIANIPNKGIPMLVLGTPMHAQDILLKLREDPSYIWRFLPALRPDEDEEIAKLYGKNEVLWPKLYDKKWLEEKAKSDWNSFQTEFLLTPAMEVAAFFTREELAPVLIDAAFNHPLYVPYAPRDDEVAGEVFAGYDVGKKRHPSHLSVLIMRKDKSLRMIHQSFHDHVDYQEQARRLKLAVENFGIRRLLYDNTRAELEERDLDSSTCQPAILSARSKKEMATLFGKHVSERTIELSSDIRFITQIISVSSDLDAPETPLGHGESFISVSLAISAYHQIHSGGSVELGSMGAVLGGPRSVTGFPGGSRATATRCPVCGSYAVVFRRNGENVLFRRDADQVYCLNCRVLSSVEKEVLAI